MSRLSHVDKCTDETNSLLSNDAQTSYAVVNMDLDGSSSDELVDSDIRLATRTCDVSVDSSMSSSLLTASTLGSTLDRDERDVEHDNGQVAHATLSSTSVDNRLLPTSNARAVQNLPSTNIDDPSSTSTLTDAKSCSTLNGVHVNRRQSRFDSPSTSVNQEAMPLSNGPVASDVIAREPIVKRIKLDSTVPVKSNSRRFVLVRVR
jgi:hypothetical protein